MLPVYFTCFHTQVVPIGECGSVSFLTLNPTIAIRIPHRSNPVLHWEYYEHDSQSYREFWFLKKSQIFSFNQFDILTFDNSEIWQKLQEEIKSVPWLRPMWPAWLVTQDLRNLTTLTAAASAWYFSNFFCQSTFFLSLRGPFQVKIIFGILVLNFIISIFDHLHPLKNSCKGVSELDTEKHFAILLHADRHPTELEMVVRHNRHHGI